MQNYNRMKDFLEILEIQQKVFPPFDNVFHGYLMRGLQKYAKIEISPRLFELPARYDSQSSQSGSNFGLPSKIHDGN